MKQTQRANKIEGELEQLREDAQNARFNMEQFGLNDYSASQIHQWKEAFEEGLVKISVYSNNYRQITNDNSILGINARKSVLTCIDYLTQEMISRIKLKGGKK